MRKITRNEIRPQRPSNKRYPGISSHWELNLSIPIVVRMEGTNVAEGRKILTESELNFTVASGMRDAAEKVVRLAQ